MTPETQKKILKAISQLFSELEDWLKRLYLPEGKIIEIYDLVLKENGMMAKIISSWIGFVLPSSKNLSSAPETYLELLRKYKSGELATWLLDQPEPTPDELNKHLNELKNSLANFRQHLLFAAKGGPRHKRGGRPRELDDPKVRREICAKIKELRGPSTKLQDIFKKIARDYKSSHSLHRETVSPATIKHIWQECEKLEKD